MYIKMKYSQLNRFICGLPALVIVALLANCSSTPQEKQPNKSPLTPAEANTYQEALNNIKVGELDKASTELNRLMQAHPMHLGVNINLATAYYKNKRIEDASRVLAGTKKINAEIPEVYNLSGLIDVEKGEYNSAEKNYLAAISHKKDYAVAHYNLALMYDIFYQDFTKAIPQYEAYLALIGNEDKNTLNWVAELKLKQKRRSNP
jgi:Tfp pilus assembly protein PilF